MKNSYHHGDLKNALIQAGVEILVRDGVGGLSLRKVAKQAGVSHAAPYSHFADKQALIAAISTEGFNQLFKLIRDVRDTHKDDVPTLLVETAWAYMQYALNAPDRFRLMFSGELEKGKKHPDFVKSTTQNFNQLVEIVQICQQADFFKPGPADLAAVSLWGAVHGITMLVLDGQILHTVLEKYDLRQLLLFELNKFTLTEIKNSGSKYLCEPQ